jgi:hypothetical protein
MKSSRVFLTAALVALLSSSPLTAVAAETPTPMPTASPSATATPTASPSATATPKATPTAPPTPTATAKPTPTPTPTAVPSATAGPATSTAPTPGDTARQAPSASVAQAKAKGFSVAPVPTVSGTAKVGQTLTAKVGKWAPGSATLTFQWKRGGTVIKGATSAKYKLVTPDAGRSITVSVTGTKSGYVSVTKTSAAVTVPKLKLKSAATPTISGKGAVGQTLTASAGSWTPGPVSFSYQWKRNGVAISQAKSKNYTLVSGDAGKKITVSVTGIKTGYVSATKTSAAKAVQTWVDSTYGTFAAKSYKGSGDTVVTLPKGAATAIVSATYSGDGYFSVNTLDSGYDSSEYLMSSFGSKYSGSMAYGLSEYNERSVRLQVQADGPWSIKVAPMNTATTMPKSGSGDKVYLYPGSAGTVALSYSGKSLFSVEQYTADSWNYLASSFGAYRGSVPIDGGPSVIQIMAEGKWTAAVRR